MAEASVAAAAAAAGTGTEWSPAEEGVKRSQVLKHCIQNRETRLTVVLFILCLLMILSLVALFVIAVYLDYHPRLPDITIVNATVGDLSVRSDVAGPYVNVSASFAMEARSPYAVEYAYEAATLRLTFGGGQPLGGVETPAFEQGRGRKVAPFAATVRQNTYVGDAFVGDLRRAIDGGRVDCRLAGNIPARFRASRVMTRGRIMVPVDCVIALRPPAVTVVVGADLLFVNCKKFH